MTKVASTEASKYTGGLLDTAGEEVQRIASPRTDRSISTGGLPYSRSQYPTVALRCVEIRVSPPQFTDF